MIEIDELKIDQRPIHTIFIGSLIHNWRSNRTSLLLCLLQKNRKCTNCSALKLVSYVYFPWYLWCIIYIRLILEIRKILNFFYLFRIQILWNNRQFIVFYSLNKIHFYSSWLIRIMSTELISRQPLKLHFPSCFSNGFLMSD